MECQLAYHQLSFSLRSLQRNCSNRRPRIRMFKQSKVKKISPKNLKKRVHYDIEHRNETVKSLWQWVLFTDETHVDPDQVHRTCILREEGTRLHSDNMQEMPDTQRMRLHMTGSVS